MPKHIKPTKDEITKDLEKTQEDLEKLEETSPPPEEDEPVEADSTEEKENVEETPLEPVEEVPEEEPEEDLKKKLSASAREAQVLYAKNKKVNEAIERASGLPEPTEEDMKKEYPDWDVMGDFEKKLAKDSFISTRRFAVLEEATKEFRDIDAWAESVDKFVEDPKTVTDNPALDGRLEEFKLFATKQTRRGVDFGDLVSAFLYEVGKTVKPPTKGKMFEVGSGGLHEKPKSDKIPIEEARKLRDTDYNEWKRLLREGKIEAEII